MINRLLLLVALASLIPVGPLPAELIFSDSFSYDLPDMAPLAGDAPEGRPGVPWKSAVEQPAARIFLGGSGDKKSLVLTDTRQKPREEIYAFLDRLSPAQSATVYYGATIIPAQANDDPESGRFLSFSTSDKRGEGVTRARLSMWMKEGGVALGIDSDGVMVEGSRTFPLNQPVRVVVGYTFGGGSMLWAGEPGKLSEETGLIAESQGHRKDPFSCFWIGIPSNSQLEIDDLVISTTWKQAAKPPKYAQGSP